MSVQITLLGVPSVRRDGVRVVLDTRKALALIAHLALCDRARARESLCALLWPEHDARHARGALRRTLSTVRAAIGEEHVRTVDGAVSLNRGTDLEIDVDRFRALAADAGPDALDDAVALFQGTFLEGFALRDSIEFEDWQCAQAALLDRELAAVLRRLVGQRSAQGQYEQALGLARRWLVLDPLHEPAHRELIRLHALTGDRAAALEQYRDCVRTLSRELGVAPLEETAALYEQVNDGRFVPPPTLSRPLDTPASRPAPPRELPLVGRDIELAALVATHAAARLDGRLAVIEGEAGIGKTRLFDALAGRARVAGAVVLVARCHDDEAGLPYGPIVELLGAALASGPAWQDAVSPQRLADAALLLPELLSLCPAAPAPLPLDGPGARVRLLEAVGAVLEAACAGPVSGIVFLDDIHGADEATIDAVAHLGRRLSHRPVLLVVSWRTEAIAPGHRLRRLAFDAARAGNATIVRPQRLSQDEVAGLVQVALEGATAADLEQRVFLESEGLPLFVAQYLAAHAAGETPPAPEALPAHLEGFFTARLAGLGSVTRQVLSAAAAIGRSFDFDTLRDASGRDEEELVGALDELLARAVVREVAGPEPRYDFSHQKLRSLIYAETSFARRRLLHRRIAAALSKGAGADGRSALVAKHLRLAGDDAAAAAHYRMAAEHAAALHAHADALNHLDASLALGDPDIAGAHGLIGDLRTLLGDYVGALKAYEAAAAHADAPARVAIEHKLGCVHQRRGEWARAEARFQSALQASDGTRPGLEAQIEIDLGHNFHLAGDGERAAALAGAALARARTADDARRLARAHNLLGVLARDRGDLTDAAAQLETSLVLARGIIDAPAQVAALNNRALVARDAGNIEHARALTREALALCVAHGDRHREAALENNLADIHHAAGDDATAMKHLKRAVAIFAEVEVDEATRLPEVWKLASW